MPVETLLKPFEEPLVVVCAHWASLAWFLLVARQLIASSTTVNYLLGLDVVLAVELEKRALLLASLGMPSVLHHDLVIRGLSAVILLAV